MPIPIVVATVVAMEGVATAVHRWWMHGPGWRWHRSHHQPGPGRWEANDLHGLAFAALTLVLFAVSGGPQRWIFWVAVGITVYGGLYAVFHDGLAHGRWGPRVARAMRWMHRDGPGPAGWLARRVQAHRLHHAVRERDGAVSFGFLHAAHPATLARTLRARKAASGWASPRAGPDGTDSAVGLVLAAAIVTGWTATVGCALFLPREPSAWEAAVALPAIALITWLQVGLFIVAHDAMHGSLAPAWPRLARATGALCLALYAGFVLRRFEARHHDHHRHAGTPGDPDFHRGSAGFWRWYGSFMGRYVGWREVLAPAAIFLMLTIGVGVPVHRALLYWAVPSLLSSLQLFAFGTWLPHRPSAVPFADGHRARSSGFGPVRSLLTCFHFGHHLEHHRRPDVPWWRLPAVARLARTASDTKVGGVGSAPVGGAPVSGPRPRHDRSRDPA